MNELLQRVGMRNRGDHYPTQLSGGEQQRIAIARGLANNPELLLLDEPTGDLDTLNTIRIVNLLVELHNMGVTLVMVTHDASLPKIATRVIVMNDGKVKEELINSDEQRFEALSQLNAGIEDLSVFESGNESIESNRNCSRTDVRKPCDYEDVYVLESTEGLFDYSTNSNNTQSNSVSFLRVSFQTILSYEDRFDINCSIDLYYFDLIYGNGKDESRGARAIYG